MNMKDFENKPFKHDETSPNNLKSLKSQLENISSKRERINQCLESILRKERDLKMRIYINEAQY